MPCMSYDNSWDSGSDQRKIKELKKQADMLARIACKAMAELEKNEQEDFLLLKDDEVRQWWLKHKEDDRQEQARLAEIERKRLVREEALARLSDEEKELLGLAPKKPQSKAASPKRKSGQGSLSNGVKQIYMDDSGAWQIEVDDNYPNEIDDELWDEKNDLDGC